MGNVLLPAHLMNLSNWLEIGDGAAGEITSLWLNDLNASLLHLWSQRYRILLLW